MNQEKLQEVFSNEDFVKELLSKETPEELQEMLAEKDIDITIEEIKETRKILIKKAEKQTAEGEELTELFGHSLGQSSSHMVTALDRLSAQKDRAVWGTQEHFAVCHVRGKGQIHAEIPIHIECRQRRIHPRKRGQGPCCLGEFFLPLPGDIAVDSRPKHSPQEGHRRQHQADGQGNLPAKGRRHSLVHLKFIANAPNSL